MWEAEGEMQEITVETNWGQFPSLSSMRVWPGELLPVNRREEMDEGGENLRGGFSACPQPALKSH